MNGDNTLQIVIELMAKGVQPTQEQIKAYRQAYDWTYAAVDQVRPGITTADLAAAYVYLRRVEHRLQMVADRQTHDVPEKPAELARIAVFLGYPDADAFARGYDAGISIEPHMVVVFHDAHAKVTNDADVCANFVEYGRRLEKLIADVKAK